jgi:cellobiose-specific phosphotransferase system component IIB
MSQSFYSEKEENNLEESLNKYEYLFKHYFEKPPTLEEALIELFRNEEASENDAKKIYEHLLLVCNNKIEKNWEKIKQEYKLISKDDALIISSYTYEPQTMYEKYSPYRILNTNLVENDRKKGVINVEKYLFLFLRALRSLQICKKDHLFRCINRKVELEEFLYIEGLCKTFWAFTSTSDVEKISEKFLNKNGEGTKYKIVGDNLWGYDITLFNVYDEKEILLEPETKYYIEKVKKGNVIEVTCKVIDKSKYKLLKIINAKMKVNVSKIYLKIYIIYSVL